MEWLKPAGKIAALFNHYKFFFLIIALGICLMLIPSVSRPTDRQKPDVQAQPESVSLESLLSDCLSQVDGAGKVQVLLTVAAGAETIYQTDRDERTGSDSADSKIDTVLITDANRGQSGLIRQTIPAKYQGAIVLCQGADSASVRLAITQAVSSALGLRADRIAVLKMK